MTPLRTKMIRDRQLQRLAPKTQKAYVTAVARFAKFYQCPPDRLSPAQIRTYLHHLLVERRLAWRSCNQAAARQFSCCHSLPRHLLRRSLLSLDGLLQRMWPATRVWQSPLIPYRSSVMAPPGGAQAGAP